MSAQAFDLIVIGGGPAGYSGAIRAAQYGLSVALVERDALGGTCLNRGCVPAKALLHAGKILDEISRAEMFGIDVAPAKADRKKVFRRKDEVVERLRDGIAALMKANKITVFNGVGSIQSTGSVSVKAGEGNVELTAKNILIATGSVPALPPIPGSGLPGVLTSDDILDDDGNFQSLVIVGGGVIGVEFASIFHSLGCKVTVIEAIDRILPPADVEIARNLAAIFKKRGVDIFAGASVSEIAQSGGSLACNFTYKDQPQSVVAERVLIATGRRANTEGVFADSLGIETARGIVADEHFKTSVDGIYAVGDVRSGNTGLAHTAAAEALAAVAHIASKEAETDLATVPACIYTAPEIAWVGLSEAAAKEKSIGVKVGKYIMGGNARTMIEEGERGFIKLVFDANDNRLLGAQLMCERATDLVSELALAVANKLTAKNLLRTMRAHPTFSEGVTEAVESIFGESIHSIRR